MEGRRSSKGNPWHDAKGRFCHGPEATVDTHGNPISDEQRKEAVCKSEKTPEEYERQTEERMNLPPKQAIVDWLGEHDQAYEDADRHLNGVEDKDAVTLVDWISEHEQLSEDFDRHFTEAEVVNGLKNGNIPFYDDDERTAEKHRILARELGADEYDEDGFSRSREVFEIDGVTYHGCEKCVDGNGNIFYEATADDGYSRMITAEKYERRKLDYSAEADRVRSQEDYDALTFRMVNDNDLDMDAYKSLQARAEKNLNKPMPWETDAKYKNNKNAQLQWLLDHPESKYNDVEFITGIKRIEGMSDAGVSAERRRSAFKALCDQFNMSESEGMHFIQPEFLR